MNNAELAAVIGGSLGGLLVLIGAIAVIVCLTCGPKNRKKKRDKKKFHQLPPNTESGRQSQQSTLSHIDNRGLPKVSSNGLWVEAPGVYAPAPVQGGYYYSRPSHKYRVEPPAVHRANSDTRLQPVPGHPVYQGNVRIYHSQQLAPVYEVIDPTRGGLYNVYEYGEIAHSRSRLINRDSVERNHKEKSSKKVKRSQSDVGRDERKTKDKRNSEKKHSSHERQPKAEVHRQKSHSLERLPQEQETKQKTKSLDSLNAGSYDNHAFVDAVFAPSNVQTVDLHIETDSMKLQDKKGKAPLMNKTDDEKQVKGSPVQVEEKEDVEDLNVQHYVYKGSIYAVPNRNGDLQSTEYENPIVEIMEEMIREKTGEGEPKMDHTIQTEVVSNVLEVQDTSPNSHNVETGDATTNSGFISAHGSNEVNVTEPSVLRQTLSVDTVESETSQERVTRDVSDGAGTEDTKGKDITAEAFQFLENYLSDEEGVESPPMSPSPVRSFTGY